MTAFRKGDVVGFQFRGGPYEEGRISDILESGTIGVVFPDKPREPAAFQARELTLLRRPVRIGDVLSWGAEVDYNRPHERHFLATEEHAANPSLHKYAEHADGTPIDAPGSSHPPLKAPRPIRPNDVLRATGAHATIVNGRGDRERVPTHLGGGMRWSVGPSCILPPVLRDWEHADGAPIERPKDGDVAVQAGPAPLVAVERSELSVEKLARGLFDTDPDVLAIVLPHADATLVPERGSSTSLNYEGAPSVHSWRVEKVDARRMRHAVDRAYARGVFGYAPEVDIAARSWARAEAVVAAMRGAR